MSTQAPTQAGWHPDPTSRHELRYFDGQRWTEHVSDRGRQATDPLAQSPSVPSAGTPTKVCPHCGAMAQTAATTCPNCGKGYRKRTALKVFAAVCAAGLVLIGGCTALVVGGASEVAKQLDAEQRAHAISKATFDSLSIGMSEEEVIAAAGKEPENRQEFESEGFLDDEPQSSSCIYYNRAGGEFGDVFQLCFDDGKLRAKNAY